LMTTVMFSCVIMTIVINRVKRARRRNRDASV
jgi:hypothetical protein